MDKLDSLQALLHALTTAPLHSCREADIHGDSSRPQHKCSSRPSSLQMGVSSAVLWVTRMQASAGQAQARLPSA